jgi:hypothetical protein
LQSHKCQRLPPLSSNTDRLFFTLSEPGQGRILSSGEVRFLRVYLYFPLAAKRTSVPGLCVPAYQYFCRRYCLNGGPLLTLRASGWIACSIQVVVPLDEL